jgi:hypothetical protein
MDSCSFCITITGNLSLLKQIKYATKERHVDSNKLAVAVRAVSSKVIGATEVIEHGSTACDDLKDAAELIKVLSRIVEGQPIAKAFGAPGDWGYGTPIGDALANSTKKVMTEIMMKDGPREMVERESEGRQTVLRTAKGQASHFNIIPAFRLEDISPELGTGLHPAFVVNGVEKREILIGTYQATVRDGEALSLPGENPTCSTNFDVARAACSAAGPGFHLMTNWEWAAIALWMLKNGFGDIRGNTNSGRSHSHPDESGTVCQHGKILTGSGPVAWRHDKTPFGIADLVGNVWEWNDGLKLDSGRIFMPADNAFGLAEDQWSDTGAAIDFAGGMRIAENVTKRRWDSDYFKNVTAKDAPLALKQALLCPLPGLVPEGYFWADNNEGFEALPLRGGRWGVGGCAGLAALLLVFGRSDSDGGIGFRPAFIG